MIKITKSIIAAVLSYFLIFANTVALAQSTAAILPQGKTQFFDNNGNPLSSGKVYFYVPSTTTTKTTWADSSKTTANANPVILDAGGRAIIYGDGTYRQVVRDRNNNLIYDAVTASTGSGSGTTGTGDGDLVGTVKPWAGLVAPNQYAFAYGQEISRSTYSVLFTAITLQQSITCASGNPTATGFSDTTQIPVGGVIESICFAAGTTVVSKTNTTVTFNNNAGVTTTDSARLFLYGNGNGSTTFNLPDLRGYNIIGRCNMGGSSCAVVNSTHFLTNPNATGARGGIQLITLDPTQLPPYTPAGIVTAAGNIVFSSSGTNSYTPAGTNTSSAVSGNATAQIFPTGAGAGGNRFFTDTATGVTGTISLSGGTAAAQTFTGTAVTATFANSGSSFVGTPQGGANAAFTNMPPGITLNYVIKITPDSNSADASGVTSIQGMTGDIACGTGLTCTGNIISAGGSTWTASGTGGATRTIQDTFQERGVSVVDYGGVCDNSATAAANGTALTNAGAASEVVFVPKNCDFYLNNVTIPSTIKKLYGEGGPQSSKIISNTVAANLFLTLAGDIEISGLTIQTDTGASGNWGIFSAGAWDVRILDNEFIARVAAEIGNATSVIIQNNTISAWRSYGLILRLPTRGIISNNIIYDAVDFTPGNGLGILCDGCANTVISGNTLSRFGSWGIIVTADTGTAPNRVTVSNNILRPNGIEAIGIVNTIGATVSGNTIFGTGTNTDSCITVQGSVALPTRNVSVSGNSITNCAVNGIQFVDTATDNTASGNTITNVGYSATNDGSGVAMYRTPAILGTPLRNTVVGNIVSCTGICGRFVYGYNSVSPADYSAFIGNSGTGFTTALVNIAGANDRAMNNNDIVQSSSNLGLKITKNSLASNWQINLESSEVLGFSYQGATQRIAFGPSGEMYFPGSSSGFAQLKAPAAAGSPVITFGTSTGTPAVTASAPLAINTTTGNITCATCATTAGASIPTIAQGDLLYGSAANTLSALAKDTNATRYLSNTGSSNNPAWAQINLTNGVTGTLPVTSGGLGITSGTSGGIPYFSASNTIASSAALASTSLVLGGGAGNPPVTNSNLFYTAPALIVTQTAATFQTLYQMRTFDNTGSSTAAMGITNSSGTGLNLIWCDGAGTSCRNKVSGNSYFHAGNVAVSAANQWLALYTTGIVEFGDGTGIQQIRMNGTAPTLSSCGTSPTIAGSDTSGTVTMGTGSPTGCVITFASTYSSAPHCNVTWRATPLASQSYAVSTSAITLTQTATSSNVVDYVCFYK